MKKQSIKKMSLRKLTIAKIDSIKIYGGNKTSECPKGTPTEITEAGCYPSEDCSIGDNPNGHSAYCSINANSA